MHFIDVIIILAFITQAIYSGFRSKYKASQNLTEYLLAGRSIKGWQISLLFGAGTGSVLVLRWLWERINLNSDLYPLLMIAGGLISVPFWFKKLLS